MKNMLKRAAIALLLVTMIVSFAAEALAGGYIKTTGKVNLRRYPGLDEQVLRTVPKGVSLYYTDTSYDARGVKWFEVEYDGYEGWISSNYTNAKDYDYDGYVQSSGMPSSGYATTTGNTYIRKQPTMSSEARTTVPKGKYIHFSDIDYDERGICWLYVTYNGKSGWMSTRYTEEYGEWNAGHSGASGTVYITDSVNIRSFPGLEGDKLGSISGGKIVDYAGSKEYDERGVLWYRITYKGITGWVSSKYAELY